MEFASASRAVRVTVVVVQLLCVMQFLLEGRVADNEYDMTVRSRSGLLQGSLLQSECRFKQLWDVWQRCEFLLAL